jgi:hypothetical protein
LLVSYKRKKRRETPSVWCGGVYYGLLGVEVLLLLSNHRFTFRRGTIAGFDMVTKSMFLRRVARHVGLNVCKNIYKRRKTE